jgi:hypothetical protein
MITNLLNLPIEIFHRGIFNYLTDIEILNISKVGNKKLAIIAEDYLKCK